MCPILKGYELLSLCDLVQSSVSKRVDDQLQQDITSMTDDMLYFNQGENLRVSKLLRILKYTKGM